MRVLVETNDKNIIVSVKTEDQDLAVKTARWHVSYVEHVPASEIISAKIMKG
jgi:hypothetical protein